MRPYSDVTARRLCVLVPAKPPQALSSSGGVQFFAALSSHTTPPDYSSLAVVGGASDHTMAPTKDLSSDCIAQIVGLKAAGHTIKEICQFTGAGPTSVKKYVQLWRQGGCKETPKIKPRPGGIRKTSKRANNILKRTVESQTSTTARKIKEENPGAFAGVSVRTVSRRLHELGYNSYKRTKKPLITKKQKVKRCNFAKKYGQWTDEQWLRVLWSDEANFNITCNRNSRVYRRKGSDPLDPRYIESTVKHPDTIMVWGCFTGLGPGKLVVLPPNVRMNAEIYMDLLAEHLHESFELTGAQVFQQDGAPCHTARAVKDWLSVCEIPVINDWPGNSPDINPIENLWSIIKKDLQKKDVSSLPRLEAAIRESWANIPPQYLHNLALSLPKWLQQVLKRKGGSTKY